MYDYKHYTARFDRTPRVKRPMVSEVYFAWCHQNSGEWEEGECYLQPDGFYNKEHPSSVDILEEDRRGNKFDLDYEKGYFDDHYLMLVMKYRKGDREYILFLTPEHAHGIIEHGINCDDYGVMIQPKYSWEELNLKVEEENDD